MTAKELLSNYAKAENEFFTAIETIRKNKEKEYISLFVVILLISSISATWFLISVAPKSYSVATQVINDFRNNKYEIYKTEIINSDTTYYYRLKQKE